MARRLSQARCDHRGEITATTACAHTHARHSVSVETRPKDLRWILHSKRFEGPSPPPWMRIRIVRVGWPRAEQQHAVFVGGHVAPPSLPHCGTDLLRWHNRVYFPFVLRRFSIFPIPRRTAVQRFRPTYVSRPRWLREINIAARIERRRGLRHTCAARSSRWRIPPTADALFEPLHRSFRTIYSYGEKNFF